MSKLLNIAKMGLYDEEDFSEEIKVESKKDIAIIGISAKMPMADSLDEFWENIVNRTDCLRNIPDIRKKDCDNYLYSAGLLKNRQNYSRLAYLDEIDKFDYKFFSLSPKEASLMDPNQRMFLECVWNAVEDAGYGGERLMGSRTGVYIGFRADDFYDYKNCILGVEPGSATGAFTGNMTSIIASRISYLLNLKGPSLSVDTACSASLVAVHLACQSIRNRECDMAIAGGIRLNIMPLEIKDKLGIESVDGRARAFDDNSDGTGIGEGVIAIMLKPLNKALRDGDSIYAVIKGSAMNQDGASAGLTAPNVLAQEELIDRAWKDAGINPETISYIETHGTGTKLGDPIEVEGIERAFRQYTDRKQFCAVASVKTNVGHLDNAAGIAGLIQAVLALKNRKLPPNFHFNSPNRKIVFEDSPVYVNDRLRDWASHGSPRRCGISSFGFSGTNCHVILEEAPEQKRSTQDEENTHKVLALSAKSEDALKENAASLFAYLQKRKDINLSDFCYTLNTGRGHYGCRIAFAVRNTAELKEKLAVIKNSEFTELKPEEGIYFGTHKIVPDNKKILNKNEITESTSKELTDEANYKVKSFIEEQKNSSGQAKEICILYTRGASVKWSELYKNENRKKMNLPAYSFERIRCWLEMPDAPAELTCESPKVYYTTRWKESESNTAVSNVKNGTVLVMHSEGSQVTRIINSLQEKGIEIISVKKAESFAKLDEKSYSVGNGKEDYEKLLGYLKEVKLSKIVHAFTVNGQDEAESLEELKDRKNTGVISLMHLISAVKTVLNGKSDIVILTEYANSVLAEQKIVKPENAMLAGMGKSAKWEHPVMSFRFIDIDGATDSKYIAGELLLESAPYQVAYRNGKRYEDLVEKVQIPPKNIKEIDIKNNGLYLITGGTGGIGLEFGKYLAQKNKVNIAFINRKKLPERDQWDSIIKNKQDKKLVETLEKIREIENTGSKVALFSADVSEEASMKEVIKSLKSSYGRINGVIHAAGVSDGNPILNETADTLNSVLCSKVDGTWILDRLTRDENPDFFVMFSSVITLIGKAGGAGYTSANTYLDSFAGYRSKRGNKTLTVNWPAWKEIGMLAGANINEDKELFKSLLPMDAIGRFEGALNLDADKVFIGELNMGSSVFELGSQLPFSLSKELSDAIRGNDNKENKADKKQNTQKAKAESLENGYTHIEGKIAEIWREKLGFKEISLNDNFFEIGGDSIMITTIHRMLEETFPGKVTVADLFLYPTIAELAQFISGSDNGQGFNPDDDIEKSINDILSGMELDGFAAAARESNRFELKGKEDGAYTDTELKIAEVWREKLGYSEINLNDNFFEIGGDSIMITKVHAMLDEVFPGKLTVADLFMYPSITELAQYLDSESQQNTSETAGGASEDSELDMELSRLFDEIEKGGISLDKANELVDKWGAKDE